MENNYFVKFKDHSPKFYELIRQRPTAFVLLAIIADRARKVPVDIEGATKVGEAFIGDYKEYGATPQSYRTDKKYLEKFKMATFKSTSKGTIAKIVNASIFDISRTASTSRPTNEQQPNNNQATTKQEVRSESDKNGMGKGEGTGSKNKFSQDTSNASKETLGNSSKVEGSIQITGSKRSMSDEEAVYYKELARKFIKRKNKGDYTGKEAVAEVLKRISIWKKHASLIAKGLDIDTYSDLFKDTEERWIIQADYPNSKSIQGFLEASKEQEAQTNEILSNSHDLGDRILRDDT